MPNIPKSPQTYMIKKGGIATVAFFTALSATVPAYATIDNTAQAVGTFGGSPVLSNESSQSVPVVNNRNLEIAKSVFAVPTVNLGTNSTEIDAGDQIVYRYTVTNTGSLTETGITVADVGPTFDGEAGAGTLSSLSEITAPAAGAGTGTAASLAPGETVVFEATYTLATLDIVNAADVPDSVSNIATATSSGFPNPPVQSPPAITDIPAIPRLVINKVATLNDEINADGLAEVGETITYVYTVENTGNVAIDNVSINDTHEGALLTGADQPAGETITVAGPLANSDLGAANDGTITSLAAGATATFTVTLTVTQQEVDDG